jgi:hypothetical protein
LPGHDGKIVIAWDGRHGSRLYVSPDQGQLYRQQFSERPFPDQPARQRERVDHDGPQCIGREWLRRDPGPSNTFAILTESTIVANLSMGLHPVSGGNIISMQNNAIVGNVADANPTSSISLK